MISSIYFFINNLKMNSAKINNNFRKCKKRKKRKKRIAIDKK